MILRLLTATLLCSAVLTISPTGSSRALPEAPKPDYGTGKDAISSREAGKLLLELVNAERAKQGLNRLQFSAPASELARQQADDMAQHGYVGHYDLAGRKCELRYNRLGETDHVAENLAQRQVGARVRLTPELVRSIFADWLASDSHRENILAPGHTHMGYGFAVESSGELSTIYAVQEFINDWGDYDRFPATAKAGAVLKLRGHIDRGARLAFVALGSEPPPGTRTAAQVGADDLHYRQPQPTEVLFPNYDTSAASGFPWGESAQLKPRGIEVLRDSSFAADLTMPDTATAQDSYITLWVTSSKIAEPFRAMTQVVRVEP